MEYNLWRVRNGKSGPYMTEYNGGPLKGLNRGIYRNAGYRPSPDGMSVTLPNGDGWYKAERSFDYLKRKSILNEIAKDWQAFGEGRTEITINGIFTIGVLPSDKGPYIQIWQLISGKWQESGDYMMIGPMCRSNVLYSAESALIKSNKGQPTPNECLTH